MKTLNLFPLNCRWQKNISHPRFNKSIWSLLLFKLTRTINKIKYVLQYLPISFMFECVFVFCEIPISEYFFVCNKYVIICVAARHSGGFIKNTWHSCIPLKTFTWNEMPQATSLIKRLKYNNLFTADLHWPLKSLYCYLCMSAWPSIM